MTPHESDWRKEDIEAIREGLRDIEAGRTRPAREALAELAAKHWLPAIESDN